MTDPERGHGRGTYILVEGCLKNWLFWVGVIGASWSIFGFMNFDQFLLVVQELKPCTPIAG